MSSLVVRIAAVILLASPLVVWTEDNPHHLAQFAFPAKLGDVQTVQNKTRNATRARIDVQLFQAAILPYTRKQRVNAFARVFILNSTRNVLFPVLNTSPLCQTSAIYNTTKPSWNVDCHNRVYYSVNSQVVFEVWNYTGHHEPSFLGGTWVNVIDLIQKGYNGKVIWLNPRVPRYPLVNVTTKITYNGTGMNDLSLALLLVVLFIQFCYFT